MLRMKNQIREGEKSVGDGVDSDFKQWDKERAHHCLTASGLVALEIKNLPASAGDTRDAALILGREDPLKKEMAIQSSIFAWKIP